MNLVPEFDPMSFNAAALQLRSYRQQILASNLANSDTPGYQARDVAFDATLREQMQGVQYQPRLALRGSDARHLSTGRSALDGPELLYRTALQPSIDGNTVDPDVERAHFAENSLGFEFATALLGSTVRSRQMALTGQP